MVISQTTLAVYMNIIFNNLSHFQQYKSDMHWSISIQLKQDDDPVEKKRAGYIRSKDGNVTVTSFSDLRAPCWYPPRLISTILHGDSSSLDTTDKAMARGGGEI